MPNRALNRPQAHLDPQLPPQILPYHIRVAAVLQIPNRKPTAVTGELPRSSRAAVWHIATRAQIPPHSVTAASHLPRNPLRSPSQRCQLEHRLHIFRRLHGLLLPRPYRPGSLTDYLFHPDLLAKEGGQFLVSSGDQFCTAPDRRLQVNLTGYNYDYRD